MGFSVVLSQGNNYYQRFGIKEDVQFWWSWRGLSLIFQWMSWILSTITPLAACLNNSRVGTPNLPEQSVITRELVFTENHTGRQSLPLSTSSCLWQSRLSPSRRHSDSSPTRALSDVCGCHWLHTLPPFHPQYFRPDRLFCLWPVLGAPCYVGQSR